jgi:hypothetical protein
MADIQENALSSQLGARQVFRAFFIPKLIPFKAIARPTIAWREGGGIF